MKRNSTKVCKKNETPNLGVRMRFPNIQLKESFKKHSKAQGRTMAGRAVSFFGRFVTLRGHGTK